MRISIKSTKKDDLRQSEKFLKENLSIATVATLRFLLTISWLRFENRF